MPIPDFDPTYSGNDRVGIVPPAPIALPDSPAPPAAGLAITVDDDGGVTLDPTLGLKPAASASKGFNENLALRLDDGALATIAEDILEGVESDIQSRAEFIANYTKGLELLGLKIEESSNTKSNKRNVSKVRHPALLEACVRGQSASRGELLPAAGPCKVQTPRETTEALDELAQALERDMNDYLTRWAPEYYPDMDRGLFLLFYGGNLFKKVYNHPLKRRPVSECIPLTKLIVSEDATDIDDANRVTHESNLVHSIVRRMQIAGEWRDVILGEPLPPQNPASLKEKQAMGISPMAIRPKDQERTIYETYCDLDLTDYGMTEPGQPDDLPLPYVVTIDKDSRNVLAIRRNWREGDKEFQKRQRIVHYGLVPGMGFLCMGYLHLLGNQTKALTAIWRLLCDAGMFANFPGGVKIKGTRTGTNEIQPGPGEWVDVDVGPFDDIRQAMMPMPYKDPSPVFIQLAEIIGQDTQRMAGAIEMEVGEGRQNVPVGTVMAMIEQQTQVMAAVNKRLHSSQARELRMLKECFAEDPTALSRFNPNPARKWEQAQEFRNLDLSPASDPNIPSQTHRIMMATAKVTMAASNPDIYNKYEVHKQAWRSIGDSNPDTFLHPPASPMPPPGVGAKPPDPIAAAKLKLDAQEQQRKANNELIEAQQHAEEQKTDSALQVVEMQSKERIAEMQEETERMRLEAEQARERRAEAQASQPTDTEPFVIPGTIKRRPKTKSQAPVLP